MIYFTIPLVSGLVAEDTDIFIDRDPNASSTLNLLGFSVKNTETYQYAPNGINIRDETLQIQIKNLPAATGAIINTYFANIKTGNLTITFPEGSKNYQIDTWSVIIQNQLYVDINATLELMYL